MPIMPFEGERAISQYFATRHPRYTALGLLGHNGIDFELPLATEVLAPADGEAVEVAYDPSGYGYYVKLRTPEGEDWLLAHLLFWHLPMPGEWLAEGARVGFSGNSGMSTGPHLHLGYRPDWRNRGGGYSGYVDPLPFLDPERFQL